MGFWQKVAVGRALRGLHLMTDPALNNLMTGYPIAGDNVVEQYRRDEKGRVWINSAQYFSEVPSEAWELYIGGYQPAQKWLKDRKGEVLSFDDLRHYQRMIVALYRTHMIMQGGAE